MKISYNWLQDYVDIKKTPEEVGDLLTFHTAEIDGVEAVGHLENVVVGKVIEVASHPDADKLQVAKVDVGHGESLNIVCGAPNLEAGQVVPVALVGSVLPGDFKIEERKVRGVLSQGMICAEDELGLGDNHDGIMVLDNNLKIGKPFAPADAPKIIDVSVPANRPDLMSHFGIAREIAAIENLDLKEDKFELPKGEGDEVLSVNVVDSKMCPRYSALVIKGVSVGESPDWLREKIESVGIRSVNNIVDLTNYLMLDLGQPLHAFDFAKVAGAKMEIRPAKDGEKVQTLDDQGWKLRAGMPTIQDSEKLIDLAGIMGGKNSEISEGTDTIVLQAAKFDPFSIRRASRQLGHRTDAVGVYEKGIDAKLTIPTLAKALYLIQKIFPQAQLLQVVDIDNSQQKEVNIKFSVTDVKKLIGIDVLEADAKKYLEKLGFVVTGEGDMNVQPPTWRQDVVGVNDVVEEVARMVGFDKIPAILPEGKLIPPRENEYFSYEKKAKQVLVSAGFNEVVNYAFTSAKAIKMLGMDLEGHLQVANPISPENEYLRASLIPNLLFNVKENLKNFGEFNIFELGNVFYTYDSTDELKFRAKVHEIPKIAGIMVNTGPRNSDGKVRSESFLRLKGSIELLLDKLGFSGGRVDFKQVSVPNSTYHPGRSAVVRLSIPGQAELAGDEYEEIGFMGEIHPAIKDAFGVKAVVMLFEFDFTKIVEIQSDKKQIKDVNKYPGVSRDIAFIVDRDVQVGGVKAVMGYAGGELIEKVDLFDTYEGENVPDGKKSLAFHVLYQLPDRTLTDTEVDEQHQKVIKAVEEKYKAEARI